MQSKLDLIPAKSGLANWTSDWIPVASGGYRMASLQVNWTAVAATNGTLSVEGTNDASKTVVTSLTIDKSHGTYPTVGATASSAMVNVSDCPGWIRVKYTRVAGGGAGQFTGFISLSE